MQECIFDKTKGTVSMPRFLEKHFLGYRKRSKLLAPIQEPETQFGERQETREGDEEERGGMLEEQAKGTQDL